ncbi:MAG: Eco57I restriction-modification methylase domain-containing protein [Bacteroidia bacterium]|nr:Eco57I restriction-modification methylase domain-containing protein [Bacteroidia bacterium]
MEIFLTNDDAGFDLVIGNPPYVRQEDILPADDARNLERLLQPENKTEKATINKAYKEQLSAKVYQTYPFLATKAKTKIDDKTKTIDIYGSKVPGRSDLYVYFQLLAPALLNSTGTFCFIISNSWLDVEFGGFVQQFLLKHTQLYAIYDCNVRSFSASVNTVIYLHSAITNNQLSESQYKTFKPTGEPIQFVMNKADYTNTAYAPLLVEQEHCHENTFRKHYRIISKTPQDLWDEGYDSETMQYQSNKWGGKYLRAPEIYFTILEKGKNKLVPLKQIAEVRFGIKTGANDFFILTRKEANKWGIEEEFLLPILKSPRECSTILIDSKILPHLLFYCHKEIAALEGTNALKYIEWGEKSEIIDGQETRAFHLRPSTQNRRKWFSVDLVYGNCFWGKELRERLAVFYCSEFIIADCRLYTADIELTQIAYLNSSVSVFIDETLGRQLGGGGGPRSVMVYEIQNLIVLNCDILKNKELIVSKLIQLSKREILDFLNELGFDRSFPIRQQQPNPLPDRKELDDLIFDELGLTINERNEVYWATAELVKQRLDKAGSRK